MTEEKLERQAQHLNEIQQKFASSIYDLIEYIDVVNGRIGDFSRSIGDWRDLFGSTRDLMQAHVEMSRELCEVQKQVLKAYADNNLSITENSARLDKLMTKMEKHFGSDAGLDYDN